MLITLKQQSILKSHISRYGHPYKPYYFSLLKELKFKGINARLASRYLDKVTGWSK